jgi:Zn finger protein HypA/HybF involved in hydrogenase expression
MFADKISMHDFLLAKEIIDELKNIAQQKGLNKVKIVSAEIGSISLAHDGHSEHIEDISLENLEFGLISVAKGTAFENVEFKIKKIEGDNWKITDIEVE